MSPWNQDCFFRDSNQWHLLRLSRMIVGKTSGSGGWRWTTEAKTSEVLHRLSKIEHSTTFWARKCAQIVTRNTEKWLKCTNNFQKMSKKFSVFQPFHYPQYKMKTIGFHGYLWWWISLQCDCIRHFLLGFLMWKLLG